MNSSCWYSWDNSRMALLAQDGDNCALDCSKSKAIQSLQNFANVNEWINIYLCMSYIYIQKDHPVVEVGLCILKDKCIVIQFSLSLNFCNKQCFITFSNRILIIFIICCDGKKISSALYKNSNFHSLSLPFMLLIQYPI